MIHFVLLFLVAVTLTVPPAAKVIAIAIAIYGVIQMLKMIPALTPYLTGWVAIALNIFLAILSLFIPPNPAITAANLYSAAAGQLILNAVFTVLGTSATAAGLHGTVSALRQPQMLASTPPDPTIREVPARLEPIDPNDKPAS